MITLHINHNHDIDSIGATSGLLTPKYE